jgi:hypothetical protein
MVTRAAVAEPRIVGQFTSVSRILEPGCELP